MVTGFKEPGISGLCGVKLHRKNRLLADRLSRPIGLEGAFGIGGEVAHIRCGPALVHVPAETGLTRDRGSPPRQVVRPVSESQD